MNFPCANRNPCATDNPFANLSSEAPDPFLFHSLEFGQLTPPLGTDWTQTLCLGLADSAVSQTVADQMATVAADQCIVDTWEMPGGAANNPNPPVPPPVNTRGSGIPFASYLNRAQTVSVACPDGTPFIYTVPAGIFFGLNQAEADAKALSYAQEQAPAHMVCLSDLPGQICAYGAFSQGITAIGPSVGPVNDWVILGVLPPGMIIDSGILNSNTIVLRGTPTTPGTYQFSVSVTTSTGDSQTKSYMLEVAGITNANLLPGGTVGQAYSFQLQSAGVMNPFYSLQSGSLPAGLVIDPGGSGLISGTPTMAGTNNFTLGVTDGMTELTCSVNAAIMVIQGCAMMPTFSTTVSSGADTFQAGAFRTNGGRHFISGDLFGNGDVSIFNALNAWSQDATTNIGANLNIQFGAYSLAADRLLLAVIRTTDSETFLYFVKVNGADPGPYTLTFTSLDLVNLVNGAGTALNSIVCDASTGTAYVGHISKLVSVNTLTQTVNGYSPAVTAGYLYRGQIGYNPTAKRVYATRTNGALAFVDVFDFNLNLLNSFALPGGLSFASPVVYDTDTGNLYAAANDGGADGGFVVYALNATTGMVLATIRYPVAGTIFRWTSFMFYNAANRQLFLGYTDNAGTDRAIWVLCPGNNTSTGILDTLTHAPLQMCYADISNQLVAAVQSVGFNVYNLH